MKECALTYVNQQKNKTIHMTNNLHPEKKPKGIINWFIHNHVAANILMFLFIIGGIISVKSMRTETFPSIDPKIITVSVAYPGATPYEIADSITSRIEEEVVGIEGVKRVASTATEGVGSINVELLDFSDPDNVYNEVETAVNSLIDFPPKNAQRPIISKMRVTPNVMTLAIHGNVNEYTIKHWAETIEDELRQGSGVALTQTWGIRDYQISVEIPESSLRQYNLTFNQISKAIQDFSEDVPAGSIESNQGDILFRVQEKRHTGKEFERQYVLTTNNDSQYQRLRIYLYLQSIGDRKFLVKTDDKGISDDLLNFIRSLRVSCKEIKPTVRRANLTEEIADQLRKDSEVDSVIRNFSPKGELDASVFPHVASLQWNTDNFGPIYIPKKGATVRLDESSMPFYKRIISEYEGNQLDIIGNQYFINGERADSYTFQQDYYWMMGDNRQSSLDARMWGYVPFDHVVGKPVFIWFSKDDVNVGIRWERLFTTVSGNGEPVSYLKFFLIGLGLYFVSSFVLKMKKKKAKK